ncbi:putative PremRNA splicing factor [Balamuthia mandrillaris]
MAAAAAGGGGGGFWRPGAAAPGTPVGKLQYDRETEEEGTVISFNPNEKLTIAQQRVRLPIFKNREHILYLLEKYQTLVIVGETGSGKTTQIPQYLHEAGWTQGGRVVACTQPRRVAASSVAKRVADEMGCQLGNEVGFAVRFEECMDSQRTRIKFMTDGMLLRETMMDPLLSKYSVIMVDEAHERSIHTDVLMGLLKKIQKRRKELRVIVSSATLDAETMAAFFNHNKTNDRGKDTSTILSIEGRQYPVEVYYTPQPVANYIEATLDAIFDIHQTQPAGDILVFLTGQEEIEDTIELLEDRAKSLRLRDSGKIGSPKELVALPIYAGMPPHLQMKVFQPVPRTARKVVVATNIAETSITISGIVYVIDCGFVKTRAFNPRTCIDSLVVTPVSKAAAQQRAGRAGRTRPGMCFRLYTEESFHKDMKDSNVPDIQRTELSPVLIQLKALGIDNVLYFDFPTSPPAESMMRALELLYALGALDDDAKLTEPLGTTIAELPLTPSLAKMLMTSSKLGCSEEVLTIAAMLSVQSVFVYPKDFRSNVDAAKRKFAVFEGDHLTLLNVYNEFVRNKMGHQWCGQHYVNYKVMLRAVQVRKQLRKYMRKYKIPLQSCVGTVDDPTVPIRKCLVSGFFSNAARRLPDGSYATIKSNHVLHVHPSSVLFKSPPEWVIYHEVILTSKEYMRDITTIDPIWLAEAAPHFYEWKGKPVA